MNQSIKSNKWEGYYFILSVDTGSTLQQIDHNVQMTIATRIMKGSTSILMNQPIKVISGNDVPHLGDADLLLLLVWQR